MRFPYKDFIVSGLIGIGVGVALIVILGMLVNAVRPYDSTDNAPFRERSGLRLYTDHSTGCQYLGVNQGGLTPRLDEKGQQVCNDVYR